MSNDTIGEAKALLASIADPCRVCTGDEYKRIARRALDILCASLAQAPAPEAREALTWRPIETAPKDGTLVLLGAQNGVWVGKYMPVFQSGYRPDNPWSSHLLNHDHMAERRTRPTHWMPLPAAPGAEAAPAAQRSTGMTEDQERETFEKHALAQQLSTFPTSNPDLRRDFPYEAPITNIAWRAWQARASLGAPSSEEER